MEKRTLRLQKPLLTWMMAALVGVIILTVVMVRSHQEAQNRWTTFLVGDPHEGEHLFFEEKGCANCHPVNGVGDGPAPDLGAVRSPNPGVAELVSAMWNCAPRMWETMRQEGLPFPELSQEEMADLFAFLYTARYVDDSGDADRGRQLFSSKGCIRCHSEGAAARQTGAPTLDAMTQVDTPILWAQAMWNHASTMAGAMDEIQLEWPQFEGRDMNDLLAYVRGVAWGGQREVELLPADPDHGWEVFQQKTCISCHAVGGVGGQIGPDLGTSQSLPLTIVQFSGVMWNHAPAMMQEFQSRGIQRPVFEEKEIADLVAFLGSLRYFEPKGSPLIGATLYARQGCAGCHGSEGQGTGEAPALRWPDRNYHSIALATALWSHGPLMYQQTQQLGVSWPELSESDVGNLVSYLNTSTYRSR